MSEMINRVSRAIMNAYTGDQTITSHDADVFARAAVEAMREPTDDIIKAHHLVPEDNDFDERAADNWRNLIDAALGKVDA